MILSMLAILVSLNTHVGFAPLDLVVTVRAVAYSGAICVTVDGPEYHRSCAPRGKGSPPVREFKFHLGVPGEYAVITEDDKGKQYQHPIVTVQ